MSPPETTTDGGGGGLVTSPTTTLPVYTTTTESKSKKKHLTLIPLIFLIYFEVSGGPYGEEEAVKAAGPLFAIIGFLVFPFIWSIPEALITAELVTAYPGNGGYVLWATAAFGPFWGHLMGTWKFLSGVINNAAYPVLMADYLGRAVTQLSDGHGGPARDAAIIASTVILSFLNYLGLTVVGYGGVVLGVVSLAPFLLMAGFSIPKLRPRRWRVVGDKSERDWSLFLNTLFWNLNFWDNASTIAGEVEKPRKTFPKALLAAGLMTCIGYVVPLLAGTGALDNPPADWEDGFLADAAGLIAGKWLKYWVSAGSVMSAVGLYEAQLSSCAYQLVGMADLGLLPKHFAYRARWFDTPWIGIVLSTAITLALSFMSFTDIIMAANFIYSLSMLLEFAAFLWLRWKLPEVERPYRVPLRLPGLIVLCLVPSAFLVIVIVIGNWRVYAIGFGLTAVGIGIYFVMNWLKGKGLIKFSNEKSIIVDNDNS